MHANAPLTPEGRLRLCLRVDAGRPIAHIAAEAGISRRCLAKWYARWRTHGEDGLLDLPPDRLPALRAPARASPTWWKRCGARPGTGLPGSPQNLSGCTSSPWRRPPHPRASRPKRTA
ncbi:leucine zipper domain-containing protein [Streptomyces sp. NPDC050997]|uniref:helix-turn-helix domain-containing protein n=1 Tax=Streptomyces sp. NPDC050997 TaxID=3155519 RepID=UPI00343A5638